MTSQFWPVCEGDMLARLHSTGRLEELGAGGGVVLTHVRVALLQE